MSDTIDRIVILNDSAAARGGATSLARGLALRLAARGVPVTFLCGELGAEMAGEAGGALTQNGIAVETLGQARLRQRGALSAARTGLWNRAAERLVSGWIAQHDTARTVYHLHGWAQILSPSVLAALAPVAGRTVIHAHDYFLACPNGTYMDHPRGALCTRTPLSAACLATGCDKRSSAQKAWRVLRQTGVRRHLMSQPWGAIAMIHPRMAEPLTRAGLPAERLTVALNPAEPFAAERIAAERNRRIAYIGRLAPEKGPRALARAAAALGLEVTFIGEGPEEDAIRAALPGAVITGWQDRAGIARHVRDARALAMPSRLPEPFGLAAAEASLSGLPVILPDIALLSTGLEEAGIGLAYPSARADGLEQALSRIVAMPAAELREMSLRAHSAKAGIAQSPEHWVDTLLSLYARLPAQKRAVA